MSTEPRTIKFRVGDVLFLVHWSLLATLLVLSAGAGFLLSGRATPKLEIGLAVGCASVGLSALHEVAHALVARCCGLKVHSLRISAISGACENDRPDTYFVAFAVASAGLVAQFLVLVASQTYWNVVGVPETRFNTFLLLSLVYLNGFMILVNLVPRKHRHESSGTDGFLIWNLAARKLKGLPFAYPDLSATLAPETRLVHMRGFRPEGFVSGIEILNDNTTPMQFVVSTLCKHLEISQEEAVKLMVETHTKGGVLIPLSPQRAEAVAAAIASEATAAGHVLVCRVADIAAT